MHVDLDRFLHQHAWSMMIYFFPSTASVFKDPKPLTHLDINSEVTQDLEVIATHILSQLFSPLSLLWIMAIYATYHH